MNIRTKLILGYVVVALLVGIIGIVGARVIEDVEEKFDDVTEEVLPVIEALEELQFRALRVVSWANEFALVIAEVENITDESNETFEKEFEEEMSESGIPQYKRAYSHFEDLAKEHSPEYDTFLAKIKPAGDLLIKISEELIQAQLNSESSKAILDIEEEIEEIEEDFFEVIEETLEHEREEARELHEELDAAIVQATKTMILTGVGTFAIAIILGLFISQTLSRPIIQLTKASVDIGKKKFDTRVEVTSKDEVGILANSFNQMAEDLSKTTVSKKYFEGIVNSMNNSLIVLNPEGIIKEVNDATCYQLGYLTEELIGQSIEMIIDIKEFFQEETTDSLSFLGFINNVEIFYLAKGGEKIPVMFSGSTMSDDDGDISGYVCVAQNLTDIKQLEDELKKATEKIALSGTPSGNIPPDGTPPQQD